MVEAHEHTVFTHLLLKTLHHITFYSAQPPQLNML